MSSRGPGRLYAPSRRARPWRAACELPRGAAAELRIVVDGRDTIPVVDVFDINAQGRIAAIRASIGRGDSLRSKLFLDDLHPKPLRVASAGVSFGHIDVPPPHFWRFTMQKTTSTALALFAVLGLSACAGMAPSSPMFSQAALPDAVKVPDGHRVAMETVGVGQITYECKAKANMAGAFEWVFVGPKADLNSRAGAKVGTYFGPPATWASSDGSAITGTQVAVSPSTPGNIPLQLVKANPATGAGAMQGVSYVQRVATVGGVAPSSACDATGLGRKEVVKYQADYIFWKAA